MYFKFILDTRF